LGVASTTERRECADDEHDLVDPRSRPLLEPPREPPQRVPLAARSVAEAKQRGQLERFSEVEGAGVARLDLGDD
jgi:hypothetical protein